MDILHWFWVTFIESLKKWREYNLRVWISAIILLVISGSFTFRIPRKMIPKNPEQTDERGNKKTNQFKLINYIADYIHQIIVFINNFCNIWKAHLPGKIKGSRKIESNDIGLDIVNRPIEKSLSKSSLNGFHAPDSSTNLEGNQPKEKGTGRRGFMIYEF